MLYERMKEIRRELNQFEDDFTKYSFLVTLSGYVTVSQTELVLPQYRYYGCQSQVWLKQETNGDDFFMQATSDTMLIRGILYIMMELFNGCPLKEIAETDFDFLTELDLEDYFSGHRSVGIRGIHGEIRDFCAKACL